MINGLGRWPAGTAKAVLKPQAGGSLPYQGFMPERAVSLHAGSERFPG
jgi:hypothetical protein